LLRRRLSFVHVSICTIVGKLVKKLSDSFAKVAPPVLGAFDRI